VDSNCIVTIRYELPTAAGTTNFLLWGALFDGGDGAYLIQREPAGTTNAGSLSHAPRR
jgi:hypothetical protein